MVTVEKIQQATEFYKLHFGYDLFNEEGEHMLIYSGHFSTLNCGK